MKLSCRIATPAKQGTVRVLLKTYLNSIDILSIPGIGLKVNLVHQNLEFLMNVIENYRSWVDLQMKIKS